MLCSSLHSQNTPSILMQAQLMHLYLFHALSHESRRSSRRNSAHRELVCETDSSCGTGAAHPPPALGFSFPCALSAYRKAYHQRFRHPCTSTLYLYGLAAFSAQVPDRSKIIWKMEQKNGVAIQPVSQHVMNHMHIAHIGALPWSPQ